MKPTSYLQSVFKKYFLVGLFVLLPFFVTAKLLFFFIDYLNSILAIKEGRFLYVIPAQFHPDYILGLHIPGLGILFMICIVLGVGVLSRNYFGNRLIAWGDTLVARIPLARVIYNVVKQVTETFAKGERKQFSSVVIVEFPRKGLYALAFVTGVASGETQEKTQETVVNVFVPTTPNPTSGFYIMVPEQDLIPMSISVEDAFKLIVSGGMVGPAQRSEFRKLTNVPR